MTLQLDTQNLLGKFALVYGFHLANGTAKTFEYLYDTTLPIIDYLSKEKREKIKVIALGLGTHLLPYKNTTIEITVTKECNNTVKQVRNEEVIKFMNLVVLDSITNPYNILIQYIEDAKKYSTDMMDGYIGEKNKIRKYLYDVSHGGDWEFLHASPKRTLDSIFLPAPEKQAIRKFLDTFQSKETIGEYAKFNIPYKFNIMLYGIPGSGKSSTVNAIASELNSDIAIMSFSREITDSHLIKAVNRLVQLENCKVLVMEDIDCLFSGSRKESDPMNNSVSLSGILNVLDGVSRAEGLVVCMTTNEIQVLDDAMLRAGRVDLTIKYAYVSDAQVKEMLQYYFAGNANITDAITNRFCDLIKFKNISTSMLQQYFFELRKAPTQICDKIDTLLEMKINKTTLCRAIGDTAADTAAGMYT